MNGSRDTVLERVRVREVAGVFRSRDALDAAVDALLLAGFDRADIDLMAGLDAVREKLGGVYVPVEELPDVPHVPRRAFIAREDVAVPLAGCRRHPDLRRRHGGGARRRRVGGSLGPRRRSCRRGRCRGRRSGRPHRPLSRPETGRGARSPDGRGRPRLVGSRSVARARGEAAADPGGPRRGSRAGARNRHREAFGRSSIELASQRDTARPSLAWSSGPVGAFLARNRYPDASKASVCARC